MDLLPCLLRRSADPRRCIDSNSGRSPRPRLRRCCREPFSPPPFSTTQLTAGSCGAGSAQTGALSGSTPTIYQSGSASSYPSSSTSPLATTFSIAETSCGILPLEAPRRVMESHLDRGRVTLATQQSRLRAHSKSPVTSLCAFNIYSPANGPFRTSALPILVRTITALS